MHSLFCLHVSRDISFKKQQGKQLRVIYSMYMNKQAKRALDMTDNAKEKNNTETVEMGLGLGLGLGLRLRLRLPSDHSVQYMLMQSVAHKTFEIAINNEPSDRRHFRIPAEAIPFHSIPGG